MPELNIPVAFDRYELLALTEYFASNWFHLLWIWQEIHLGSGQSLLMSGTGVLYWGMLKDAVRCFSMKGDFKLVAPAENTDYDSVTRSLLGTLQLQISQLFHLTLDINGCPFIPMMMKTISAKCSDPRDKVYAILSLIEKGELDIVPDYNNTVDNVYKEVTVHQFHQIGCFLLLKLGEYHPDRGRSLPSWVPDFSHSRPALFDYRACLSSSTGPIDISGNILKMRGLIVTKIERVFHSEPTAWWPSITDDIVTDVRRIWKTLGLMPSSTYITGEPTIHAFVRAVAHDSFAEREWPCSLTTSTTSIDMIAATIVDENTVTPSIENQRRFWGKVATVLAQRSCFLSADGTLGHVIVSLRRGHRGYACGMSEASCIAHEDDVHVRV